MVRAFEAGDATLGTEQMAEKNSLLRVHSGLPMYRYIRMVYPVHGCQFQL